MLEQRGEVGVGVLVVDDETGIDRDRALRARHRNGVRMAADPPVALIDRDVVLLTEQPGRRHPGNAGTYDRYVLSDRKIAVHCSPHPSTGAVTLGLAVWITGGLAK
jgi:hypothetical protein